MVTIDFGSLLKAFELLLGIQAHLEGQLPLVNLNSKNRKLKTNNLLGKNTDAKSLHPQKKEKEEFLVI